MRIHNLYVDDKGETHFRDIEVEWKNEGRGGKTSATFPATGIIFRETPGTYDYEWHPAPRRQYIINLDGGVEHPGERRRDAHHRRGRGAAGRGHARQGPFLQGGRRQDAPFDLRADRVRSDARLENFEPGPTLLWLASCMIALKP